MPRAAQTRVDSEMEARVTACAGDGERVEVLQRARRFKASWVELGEALADVLKRERWRRWGFPDFDSYCRKELHLRPETAHKLTGSFAFLQARAPEVLRRDGMAAPIPPLEAVNFWRRAEEEADSPPREQLAELRRAVVDEGAPAGAIRRRYREVFFPTGDEERSSRDKGAVLAAAQKLIELLAETRVVEKRLAADVEEQLGRLVQELAPG
jgi:hypothetical protein